jgi:hypothetical protein
MNEQFTFQLERWTGREYVPHGAPHVTDNPHTAGNVAETARLLGLPAWRLVRVDKARPAKVTRWRPSVSRAYSRDADAVRAAYFQWAAAAGLESVTVYRGDVPRLERLAETEAAREASRVYDVFRVDKRRTPREIADAVESARAAAYAQFAPLLNNVHEVDPAEFIGPAPAAELIEGPAWEDPGGVPLPGTPRYEAGQRYARALLDVGEGE